VDGFAHILAANFGDDVGLAAVTVEDHFLRLALALVGTGCFISRRNMGFDWPLMPGLAC